jgi:hypothetical protein
MKTSNIILLSAFASIIIWILVAMFTAKAKMKEIIKEHPEYIIQNSADVNKKTVQLEPFSTIVVSGGGHLQIQKSDGWSFNQMIDEENKINLKNDTLFISISSGNCNLNVNKIRHLLLKDSVWVELSDFETDSFNIFTANDSHLEVDALKIRYIGLKSQDHSKIEFESINQPNISAEFNIKNFSVVSVDNTDGMTLTIVKDPNAKFESN